MVLSILALDSVYKPFFSRQLAFLQLTSLITLHKDELYFLKGGGKTIIHLSLEFHFEMYLNFTND